MIASSKLPENIWGQKIIRLLVRIAFDWVTFEKEKTLPHLTLKEQSGRPAEAS